MYGFGTAEDMLDEMRPNEVAYKKDGLLRAIMLTLLICRETDMTRSRAFGSMFCCGKSIE
jgi:hypothetical protein